MSSRMSLIRCAYVFPASATLKHPQSIALQLTEAIPHSHAEQIRRVAQNEGNILTRIEGLMLLITLAALFTS